MPPALIDDVEQVLRDHGLEPRRAGLYLRAVVVAGRYPDRARRATGEQALTGLLRAALRTDRHTAVSQLLGVRAGHIGERPRAVRQPVGRVGRQGASRK